MIVFMFVLRLISFVDWYPRPIANVAEEDLYGDYRLTREEVEALNGMAAPDSPHFDPTETSVTLESDGRIHIRDLPVVGQRRNDGKVEFAKFSSEGTWKAWKRTVRMAEGEDRGTRTIDIVGRTAPYKLQFYFMDGTGDNVVLTRIKGAR